MKIHIHHHSQGSVLLVTLLTGAVIGMALGSYLWMVSNQNISIARALGWNSAMTVAEAGAEEALTQVHYTSISNLTANSWTDLTNGWYYKTHSVNGSTYYETTIKSAEPPIIISTGYVPAPLASSNVGLLVAPAPTTGSSDYVKRRVMVNTRRKQLLPAAMFAKGHITLAGNNVTTDGFDSDDPYYSTNGKYDRTKRKASGDVWSNSGDTSAISVGDANVTGHVGTGTGGTVNISSGGTVGDLAWVTNSTPGIKPGWGSDTVHVETEDVKVPFTTGYITPIAGVVGATAYTYVLDGLLNDKYKLSSLSGKVYVTGGQVTLYVTDSFDIGSGDYIYIAPGASLKLYVAAPSASIGGNGVINTDAKASAFEYWGLPTNTSFAFKANAAFTGIVYAPQADFTLGGGGNNDYDFAGACVVNTIKMNGHFHFHYDEALRRKYWNGYQAAGWNEVDPSAPLSQF